MRSKQKTEPPASDRGRMAYMLAWRDHHIEGLKEALAGYEQKTQLLEALLALALLRTARREEDGTWLAELSKAELGEMLGRYESAVSTEGERYLVRFYPRETGGDGENAAQA